MNSPVEDRLREALTEAGAKVDTGALRPLVVPDRRRFRVDVRLAAAAAVVVAGAATVAGFTASGGDQQRASVAAAPKAPERVVSVFLCGVKGDPCQGGAATGQQKADLATSLRRVPGVARVSFEDRKSAYERFRKAYTGQRKILEAVKAEQVAESYRVVLRPGAQPQPVYAAAKGLPGVALVSDLHMIGGLSEDSLKQTPDVTVFLCEPFSDTPPCKRYEARSDTSGISIEDITKLNRTIMAMPRVREVRFESQVEAYQEFKRAYADNKTLLDATKVEDMPQSFRVYLKPDADSTKVAAALARQPGVSQTMDGRCQVLRVTLARDYGITTLKDTCSYAGG
ncbi:permease-like cell division protein FtsX [Nonomuraea sp. NPDC005501]|uniref:permease-like cell division protein FtsX n=1 Tax=Nonomuraea sp. NPDC005501 TaxID=3156884 RepID=UPI00339E4D97